MGGPKIDPNILYDTCYKDSHKETLNSWKQPFAKLKQH